MQALRVLCQATFLGQSRYNSIDIRNDFHNHPAATGKQAFKVMARISQKKGPHGVKTASKPKTNEEFARQEFEREVDAFAAKVHNVIQDARQKMSDDEVAKADKEAAAILDEASTSGAKTSRHTA